MSSKFFVFLQTSVRMTTKMQQTNYRTYQKELNLAVVRVSMKDFDLVEG